MFCKALFAIVKTQKQLKCPSTHGWVNKMYIYTMEYYSAIKMNEIMPFAAMWMDLKITMLSEVSQKNRYMMSLNMWKLKKMIQVNL